MEEEGERGPEEGNLLVKIHVPELNVQKCLQFPRDQLVWDVKQQCLAALPKELKESFNYGLFSPPENGRAGKFLDEERRLGDYSFNGPVGFLELKYKRRVYKMITLDEKQLKSLHTRANLRRFLDYVCNGQVEKITKMCSKGLDPNFHCQDSGETPLTIATGIKKSAKVLIALVNGGALLDYRTKDGSTAMHRSVEHKSLEAMRTLLELGASPNYKDGKGLTPVYLTIAHNVDPQFTESLLHDHATTGAQDLQGWQEVHQACKNGMLRHLEHLLFYGADMNAQNASGNTPLHVCAVNNQESCARQLLFRGADRQALNYANQTPYQVAVIAGNMDLADIIQNYRQEDVVPYRGPPSYNPKRRSAIGFLQRAPSITTLALPPSPCPSDRSSAPFSSASSSLSDGSSSAPPGHETDTASIITDKSLGDTSDIISDSSGVGTANSDATNCSISMPGTTVFCIEAYTPSEEDATAGGHLTLREGDIIEVTGATDDGLLEGILRVGGGGNKTGLFPTECVQEVRFRNSQNIQAKMMMVAKEPINQQQQQPPSSSSSNNNNNNIRPNSSRVVGRRESTSKHFATAPRIKKTYGSTSDEEPRTVVLHRGRKGFGFILRGAKATSPLMELTPSDKCPALQYLDDVDPGGVADMAGLQKGDFLLEINNEDVSSASHEHVVDLIRKSGNLVKMKVMSLGTVSSSGGGGSMMPMSKSTILPDGNSEPPSSRQCATLPRKMGNYGGTLGRSAQAPLPPRRDPKTTLSVGRARAKSMVAGLEGGEKEETEEITKSSSAESIHKSPAGGTSSTPVQLRTASIRQRPTSSRTTSSELEELFQSHKSDHHHHMKHNSLMTTSRFQGTISHQQPASSSPSAKPPGRVYASVSEMKRSKSKNSKVKFTNLFRSSGGGELHRDFHSTPDLAQEALQDLNRNHNYLHHRSQEDLALMNRARPPPSYPPPPPPPSVQLVKVDVSRGNNPEYDHFNKEIMEEAVVSSFRPTASARLYASPEDMKTVGYRSKSLPSHSARPVRKSHSMRTNSSSFKPVNTSTPPPPPPQQQTTNPYAQPMRPSRSHSTASAAAGGGTNRGERRRKISCSKSASNVVILAQSGGRPAAPAAPLIPEPDYSCSESEYEEEELAQNKSDAHHNLAVRLSNHQIHQQPPVIENSGNSNTSGSSSGSSSVPHSFSVEEIQKGRLLLKSSKSYPEDFLKKANELEVAVIEDGDNSSSGVSSDQEIATTGSEYGGERSHEQNTLMTLPSSKSQRQQPQQHNIGLLTRHAVSLAQLPPPLEGDSDEKDDLTCLPPPPEFVEHNALHNNSSNNNNNSGNSDNLEQEAVLAPPPQFSDSRQQQVMTRSVRIVGTVPKSSTNSTIIKTSKTKQGRLHSQ